jgi:hypothetical protein
MATNKKPANIVTVPKYAVFTVRAGMSPREEREFSEELQAKLAQGYRVLSYGKSHRGVEVNLVKDEHWTVEEFVAELQGQLR